MVEHNRGTMEARRGDVVAALVAFDAAADGFRAAGLDPGLLPVERAEALLAAGLAREAQAAAAGAVAQYAASGNRVDVVQARLTLAEAAILGGDHEQAAHQAGLARDRGQAPASTPMVGTGGVTWRVRARWLAGTGHPRRTCPRRDARPPS